MTDSRDSNGYRYIPDLNMSSEAKDAALEVILDEIKRLDEMRGREETHAHYDFNDPLLEDEKLLIAWFLGLLKGREQGRASEKFEQEFRQKAGLKPDDPLPRPREMLKMIDKLYGKGK